jgi:hypothetical protein
MVAVLRGLSCTRGLGTVIVAIYVSIRPEIMDVLILQESQGLATIHSSGAPRNACRAVMPQAVTNGCNHITDTSH